MVMTGFYAEPRNAHPAPYCAPIISATTASSAQKGGT
jgi:hypothetical protein